MRRKLIPLLAIFAITALAESKRPTDMLGSYVMVKQGSAWLIGAARIARTPAP